MIVYFKLGLTVTFVQCFYFYLIALMLGLANSSIGYCLSTGVSRDETAIASAPLFMMPLALFGGFLANTKSLHKWISWFQYVSPIRYALESFTRNEFSPRDYSHGEPDPVDYLGYDVGISKCLIILACLTMGLRIISFLFLKYKVTRV